MIDFIVILIILPNIFALNLILFSITKSLILYRPRPKLKLLKGEKN
jgi:hypothetical protein